MSAVTVKIYAAPKISEKEIARYAGGELTEEVRKLIQLSVDEARDALCYKVCYAVYPISIIENEVDFGFFRAKSASLAKNLSGCKRAVIFAATVGIGIDRLIMKDTRLFPARALILDALGTERVEALCDVFCEDIKKTHGSCRPRFSAGYGDLPLELQKEIFTLLSPATKIGLTLTESLLMSPTKSVTAFIGIED